MKAGDTFFLKSKSVEGGHPKIIVSAAHDGMIAFVSITEWADNKDQSCILKAGSESIIKKDSVVSYRDANLVSVEKLTELLDSGELIGGTAVSQETLDRILAGCGVTRFIPEKVLMFLDELGLIPLI